MELDDLTDDELTLVIDHLNARDLISLEAVSKRFTRNQLETAAEKNLRARYPAAAAYLQTLSPLRWRRFLHGQEQLDLDRDCARLRVSHLSQEEGVDTGPSSQVRLAGRRGTTLSAYGFRGTTALCADAGRQTIRGRRVRCSRRSAWVVWSEFRSE